MVALSPCLTIAAPSGMSLDDRTEWFMAAAGFLDTIPAGLLKEAAKQTVCDHPSKIVPAILAYARDNRETWEWRNRPASTAPRLTVVKAEKPAAPKITQREIDQMEPELIKLGLACGALVEDENGKVIAAPRSEPKLTAWPTGGKDHEPNTLSSKKAGRVGRALHDHWLRGRQHAARDCGGERLGILDD